MTSSAIPGAYVRAILSAYRKYGVDPAAALRTAQISPPHIEAMAARVTPSQFEMLSFIAMQELNDEALGWFSRRLPWGSYGMLCRASITAPDLGVALRRWARHHRLLIEDVVLRLEVAEGQATFSIAGDEALGDLREFCCVTLMRYMLGFACWAINDRIPLSVARFPFAAPPHLDIYPKLFCEKIEFGAELASVSFDAQLLARPLQRDEAALQKMLKRALPLTVLPYRRDQRLSTRVSQVLRMPNAGSIGASDLAEGFNISTRTLHRQLQSEGVSLRDLQKKAKLERAQQDLIQGTRSIKRVAYAAGFNNEKAFARAFKQWTGLTPSEFRSRNGG